MNNLIRRSGSSLISLALAVSFLAVATTNSSAATASVSFKNTNYGFAVALPAGWKGYTVINQKWLGYSATSVHAVTTGPQISIRSPLWTATKPRQDIPIMIFTSHQWNALKAENFHIGAAPIPPSLLAHNSRYVFALPARYNFAYLPGYTEVAKILAAKSVTAFERFSSGKL
jgi:hypothetical protein